MTIIYKKEPREPKKKPRTASLAYQIFQNARAHAVMRSSLSSNGLFTASSKALGKAIGSSQPTAIRIITRLIAQKKVHLVTAATDKFGKPVTDVLGRQVPNQIFPWRRPYPSVNTGQASVNTGDSSTPGAQTGAPYSSVNAYIDSSCSSELSVGSGVSVHAGTVVPHSSVNTVPPAWAVERQLTTAKSRLTGLKHSLRLALKAEKWSLVSRLESQVAHVEEYIEDLTSWGAR